MFCERTGYPAVNVMIYDADAKYFVPIFPAGALLAEQMVHPFVIVRAQYVIDCQCLRLGGCIKELMDAQTLARSRCEAEIMAMRLMNTEAGVSLHAEGRIGDGNTMYGDDRNVGAESSDVLGWENTGLGGGVDIRVMAVFDEDPKDGDYTNQTSDGSSSEEEEGSTEEEEAMETDQEENKAVPAVPAVLVIDLTADEEDANIVERIIIDLTEFSDDESVCSQEI